MPADGPLIVASNHASYFDPPLLAAAMPRMLNFLARKTLFANPLAGWYIRRLNAFPLDREGDSREALRTFGGLLDRGEVVLMFPEGTRTRTGFLDALKPGVVTVAMRGSAPILPAYVWGSYQSWPRGRKWPRRHRYKVHFGEPLRPAGGSERGRARKAELERLQEALGRALQALETEAWEGMENHGAGLDR